MGRGMSGRGAGVAGQAMWQVFPEEEARLSAQLAAHDAERYRLDQEIRKAVDRKRYSLDPEEVARAAAAERTHLLEMDRLMTSIRSLEGRLLLLHPEGLTVRSSQMGIGA
jgi:hypothetical protein